MQLIKDKQIIDNTWRFIADGELTAGDIVIPLARWQEIKPSLTNHQGRIGIRISPADTLELANDLAVIELIELDFPDFADGRLFSTAWLLRARLGFQGEIRAVGCYMPDQVFYLARVGVNAFCPEKSEDLPVILDYLNDFSVNYQRSIY